jgi:hypothetical protein
MTDSNGTARREASTQSYRDGRAQGFTMVWISATRRIREHFAERPEGLTTSTALAVYMAILELLNEQRTHDGPIHRRELAARAGVGLKAASRYQEALELAGVICVERRVVEGVNLPNIIHVLGTDGPLPRAVSAEPDPGQDDESAGRSEPDGSGREDTQLPEESSTTTSSTGEEGEEARAARADLALVEPVAVPRRPSPDVRYQGRVVPPVIVGHARELLGVFNDCTNRDLGAEKADGKPSPALTQIIGAMLARPQVTPVDWERAVRNTVAAPPSWLEGPVQIGTIFGERAAEHALSNTGTPAPNGNGRHSENDAIVAGLRRAAGVTS